MVDIFATHPLDQFFSTGVPERGDGVSVEVIEPTGMVQLFAGKGKTDEVEKALKIAGTPGKASNAEGFTAIPLAPGQWFLVANKAGKDGFATDIREQVKNLGHVSEQSDSRVTFRLSGPRVLELMQKGCRLDLHPDMTGKNWCAQTQMAQVSVLIHEVEDAPIYDLYVYSGFARDFAEWLEHTGAQLGIGFSR